MGTDSDTNSDTDSDTDSENMDLETLEARLITEVIAALAAARANPRACAERIRKRSAHFHGKSFSPPPVNGEARPVKNTKEGVHAVHDALQFLETQLPLPGFTQSSIAGLQLGGADHIHDVGSEGVASHSGSDGSGCWDRVSRYGQWEGACGECLWYGRVGDWVTGETVVDDLIVDDGVLSRGHRLALFDERYTMAGVSVGVHKTYGNMVAIELAGGYEDDVSAIAMRMKDGPARLEKMADARSGEQRTQWQLGKCRGCMLDIEGGQVVEAAGGKWHAKCFCCTQCQSSLIGAKRKKEENGRVFCHECWVELYAPTCYVCHQKIAGDLVRKGDLCRHPTCRSSPPAGLNSLKHLTRPDATKGTLKSITPRSPPRTPPRTPPKNGSRNGPVKGPVGAEVASSKRAERMVSKYGVANAGPRGKSTNKLPARKGVVVPATRGSSNGVQGSAVPKKKAASKAPQSKPSFMGAVESLNSMAMGYGDLELMM